LREFRAVKSEKEKDGALDMSCCEKNVYCVRETEILVEQQPPQGVFVCDHAGLVINNFLKGAGLAGDWRRAYELL